GATATATFTGSCNPVEAVSVNGEAMEAEGVNFTVAPPVAAGAPSTITIIVDETALLGPRWMQIGPGEANRHSFTVTPRVEPCDVASGLTRDGVNRIPINGQHAVRVNGTCRNAITFPNVANALGQGA